MTVDEAIEIICTEYCKYPDTESGNKLADICDKCPMNKCEDLRWANRKTEPNNCETCRFELYCPEMCEGCCEWDSHYEPKDEHSSEVTKMVEPQSEVEIAIEMALNNCKTKHNGCENCDSKCMWKDKPQTEREDDT